MPRVEKTFPRAAWVLALAWFSLTGAQDAPPRPEGSKQKAKPLPGLEKDKLPAQTRPKPDPLKDSFVLGPIYVKVDERIRPEKGDLAVAEVRVFENYLKQYLRRAGHPVVLDTASAAYRLEGDVRVEHHETLKLRGQAVAWKYKASSTLHLLDNQGKELEKHEVPEFFEENVRGPESAAHQIRRHLAKLQHDKIFLGTGKLGDARVSGLIDSLASEPPREEPMTAEDVLKAIVELGFPAVPHLLEALTDKRVVRLSSIYPGLKGGRSLDDLRVYHIADKALEEIFQKVSRMSLDVGPEDEVSQRHRLAIIKGWENEWKRFCKPFRESPSQQPAAEKATGKAPE